jgi:hypothetical protein
MPKFSKHLETFDLTPIISPIAWSYPLMLWLLSCSDSRDLNCDLLVALLLTRIPLATKATGAKHNASGVLRSSLTKDLQVVRLIHTHTYTTYEDWRDAWWGRREAVFWKPARPGEMPTLARLRGSSMSMMTTMGWGLRRRSCSSAAIHGGILHSVDGQWWGRANSGKGHKIEDKPWEQR